MSKFSLAIMYLAPIVLYGTGHAFLFWFATINTIIYLVTIFAIPNVIAMSAMKKFKAGIKKMEQDGATYKEIEKALDGEVKVAEEDHESAPTWLYLLGMINIFFALILLIIGIIYRLS